MEKTTKQQDSSKNPYDLVSHRKPKVYFVKNSNILRGLKREVLHMCVLSIITYGYRLRTTQRAIEPEVSEPEGPYQKRRNQN